MGMASLCGLRRRRRYSIEYKSLPQDTAPVTLRSKALATSNSLRPRLVRKTADTPNPTYKDGTSNDVRKSDPEKEVLFTHSQLSKKRSSTFEWSREDQLSVILEIWSEKGDTPVWEKTEAALNWEQIPKLSPPPPTPDNKGKRTRWIGDEYPELGSPESDRFPMMTSARGRDSPITPRAIEPPPTDVWISTISGRFGA